MSTREDGTTVRQLREPELPTEIESPLRIDAVEKTLGTAAYLDDPPEPEGS